MKQSIQRRVILVLTLAVFFSSSVGAFATTKTPIKPATSQKKVLTKKTTSVKKVAKKKKKSKKRRKEKLNLTPPLIDPLHPPGGR